MSRRSSVFRNQLLEDFSEADLTRLRLQHCRAEAAKRAHTQRTRGLVCRDQREIQRLQDEREEILRNIRVCQTSRSRWTDASIVQDLTAMLDCGDRINEELRAEKDKVASLRDQILKWERKLAEQRPCGGTTRHRCKSDNSKLLKSTFFIENKLHRGRKCFNELMTKNGQLREELKVLQMEKKHFLYVESRLEKELHAIRKDIRFLMTKCTEAFHVRVEFQEKQKMLTDQNAKDMAQYIREKSRLEREISHYCNFEAFLEKKAIVYIKQDIDLRKVEKCKHPGSKEWELEDFENAIKKIFSGTGETDLDKLVRNFIKMERQNYTLLNFVNYQDNETETIRRQISQLRSEREIFSAEQQQQREQQQAHQRRISIKQEATEQQLTVYQQHVLLMEKLLDQLREGVKSLLQISCDSLVSFDLLGFSDESQDENIIKYLSMVEDRVSELLTLQSYLHFRENKSQWDIDSLSTVAVKLLGITQPSVNMTTAGATPAPENDQDSEESVLLEAKEPVTREALLTLVNKRIQRKKKKD